MIDQNYILFINKMLLFIQLLLFLMPNIYKNNIDINTNINF
jgi:hypothetical protein